MKSAWTPDLTIAQEKSEAGAKTDDICRRHGISSATFYSWRKKYGGLLPSEVAIESAAGPSDNGDAAKAA